MKGKFPGSTSSVFSCCCDVALFTNNSTATEISCALTIPIEEFHPIDNLAIMIGRSGIFTWTCIFYVYKIFALSTRIVAAFIVSGVRLISRIVIQFLSLITDHFMFTEFVNGNP